MLTAEESIKLLLRIMEDSLADEIVEEVLSSSQDQLSEAARAHGFRPSSGEAPLVSGGDRQPENAKGTPSTNNSTPQREARRGLTLVITSAEHNLSEGAWERFGVKSVTNPEADAASREDRLLALLATLEECLAYLVDQSSADTARLLSLAILEIRMELHKTSDGELKALCDEIASANDAPGEKSEKKPPVKFGVVGKVK